MLLERFEDPGLSQYSYAVGCEGARQVAIIDPRRDVDVYLDFARQRGLAITHVLETHVHADFASGARELAAASGARLLLSAYDAGERYEVAFAHDELRDGDAVELGKVRLVALHTPGHTPEHLAFLVYDTARAAAVPVAMLSGDFLFVGSLGRPDLLGEEAKRGLAQSLFRSVRVKLAALPDGLEIHPGHGAGSMCGSGMSNRPFSTLGFERIANPFLDPQLDEEGFVARILDSAPPLPPYYRRMKELNAAGPRPLGIRPAVDALPVARFQQLALDGEHVVIDLRDQLAFGGGHVPGALGIGIRGGSLSTWAAWVVPYDRPLLLVAGDDEDVDPAARALVRVGLDGLAGYLAGGMERWLERGLPLATLPQVSVGELAQRLADAGAPTLLDVRADGEWGQGHVRGARHLVGGEVAERPGDVPAGPLAVMCGGGYRSTVVASLLQRQGRRDIVNVTGGMGAWKRAGLPVESD
ncbi:MAG TPA: rhodanese-like domain-containing protein [Thermoanaerobaculia bacterium]|jgi:hydroxyacylglutathione hydrolase|nr:rhodanese-like domain-containing protein [Thermoanaerobaculia bacterium]